MTCNLDHETLWERACGLSDELLGGVIDLPVVDRPAPITPDNTVLVFDISLSAENTTCTC
jgi:hypothetical protein